MRHIYHATPFLLIVVADIFISGCQPSEATSNISPIQTALPTLMPDSSVDLPRELEALAGKCGQSP